MYVRGPLSVTLYRVDTEELGFYEGLYRVLMEVYC